jgi:transcription initiation factor TFIID subunit 10
MNQNQKQQASDRRHDDGAALSDFLASLMDYTPTVMLFCFFIYKNYEFIIYYLWVCIEFQFQIPDELVEHYLAKSGFQCPDVRL